MLFDQYIPGAGTGARAEFAGGAGGYDAVASKGRRKPPVARTRSEDAELTPTQRILLSSSTRDIERNFSIAAWAIRKHLDYVSTFEFQASTGDDAFDDELEAFVAECSTPDACDAAGRLSLGRFARMLEARRTVDGDVFANRLADGRLQGIEGDRVRTPAGGAPGVDPARTTHGVLTDDRGRALGYAVHRRDGAGGRLEFERVLDAAFCDHHGYFARFDQVRGVSPIAAAVNPLRDVYEGIEYALAKAKVSQLFALAFYRDRGDEPLPGVTAEEDAAGGGYDVDVNRGPMILDLDPGDRAEILNDKNPSTEFQQFQNAVIAVALKALDVPFSFYDEGHTNYSGSRIGWIQYDFSCETKRADNRAWLDRWTLWRVGLGVRDGRLRLPRGLMLTPDRWGWINRGVPWIDPLKEVTGDVMAIRAGLIGPETSCRQRGRNVYKAIDERARVEAYARKLGVVLDYMLPAGGAAPDERDDADEDDR